MNMTAVFTEDILEKLHSRGLELVIQNIFEYLSLVDLKCCQLVSKLWFNLVERLWEHHEELRVGRGWSNGNPTTRAIQCDKKRAVCTVSSISVDEKSIAIGLGGSGNIELWNLRSTLDTLNYEVVDESARQWLVHAHEDGVYSLDMNPTNVVSGGEDASVKLWSRESGDLILAMNHHEYIVWNVILWNGWLTSASYDCSIAFIDLKNHPEVVHKVQGPFEWSDGIGCDQQSNYLSVYCEDTFTVSLYNLSNSRSCFDPEKSETVEFKGDENSVIALKGHEDEINCIKFLLPLIATGSNDKTVRLWSIESGDCLNVFTGHEGKVWCVDFDRNRLVSGGRHGEIRIWSLPDVPDDAESYKGNKIEGRSLWIHTRTTAVGQIKISNALLISCDGMARVNLSDFWNLRKITCGCKADKVK